MENTGSFKKEFFGFNRKEVIDYIENLHNEFYAYKKESEKTIEDLENRIFELENVCAGEADEPTVFDPEQAVILSGLSGSDEILKKFSDTADRLEAICEKLEDMEPTA